MNHVIRTTFVSAGMIGLLTTPLRGENLQDATQHLRLSEPETVALAPADVRGWGPYQFPGLERLPDGRIQASFHVEADSATAYGLPPVRAVSADEGKTWTVLRSTDNGRTWSKPHVFDDLGVWPQLLTLNNGVTVTAYGRPGLYIRVTSDKSGRQWGERFPVVKPGNLMQDSCSYASLLTLGDDRALIAYSDFNVPGPDGAPRKAIRVRTVTVKGKAVE